MNLNNGFGFLVAGYGFWVYNPMKTGTLHQSGFLYGSKLVYLCCDKISDL